MTAVGCGTVEVNPPQHSIKRREKCGLGVTAGDLVVEGSLAANPAYAALLAAFRPSQPVFAGSDAAGTARGAALLAKWPPRNFQPPPLIAAPPCTVEGLHAYRSAWTKAVLER